LRNFADLEAFLEEFAALADKKTLEKIYRMATDEPYGFLYVQLGSKSSNDMFHASLKKKVLLAKEKYVF